MDYLMIGTVLAVWPFTFVTTSLVQEPRCTSPYDLLDCWMVQKNFQEAAFDTGPVRITFYPGNRFEVNRTVEVPYGTLLDFAGSTLTVVGRRNDMGPVLQLGHRKNTPAEPNIQAMVGEQETERRRVQGITVRNVVIHGSKELIAEEKTAEGYTASCVEVHDMHNVVIEESEFHNCRSGGVVAGYPGVGLIVRRNLITGPAFDCVAIDGEWIGVEISDNKLHAFPYAAVSLDTGVATAHVINNQIVGNTTSPKPSQSVGDVGVFARDAHSITVTGNQISTVLQTLFMGHGADVTKTVIFYDNQANGLPLKGDFRGTTLVTDDVNVESLASDSRTKILYTGLRCTTDCGNGKCARVGNSETCICNRGWTGERCSQVVTTTTQSPTTRRTPTTRAPAEEVDACNMLCIIGWSVAAGAAMSLLLAVICCTQALRNASEEMRKNDRRIRNAMGRAPMLPASVADAA
jgi:hypothetical protein